MSIADELREVVQKNMNAKLYVVTKANTLLDIADCIDEEHEREVRMARVEAVAELGTRGYVKLPVDADGEVINIGDELSDERGYNPVMVDALELSEDGWEIVSLDGHAFQNPEHFSHYKSTIEDVLWDFSNRVINSGHQWGLNAEGTIADYAKKLREMQNDEEDA